MNGPKREDFAAELERTFQRALQEGLPFTDVRAGDLHARVGGYPAPLNRMPTCCSVMTGAMSARDVVIAAPPKGKGANLVVRYRLPREQPGAGIAPQGEE